MAILPRRRIYDEDEDWRIVDRVPPPMLPDIETGRPMPLPGPGGAPYELPRGTPPTFRQSRGEEVREARDTFMLNPEGRGRAGLRTGLSAMGDTLQRGGNLGQGLGALVSGGLVGLISPKTARRQQFEREVRPEIEERFRYEDADRQAQMQQAKAAADQAMNQMQLANMQSQIDLRASEIEQNKLPRPVAGPTPSWQKGRNRRTGQFTVYNAADPAQNAEHEPIQEQRDRWVVNDQGVYEDVIKAEREGRRVKALQRPKAAAKPKAAQKFASITDVREAAEKAGKTESQMKAMFREKGYTIVN